MEKTLTAAPFQGPTLAGFDAGTGATTLAQAVSPAIRAAAIHCADNPFLNHLNWASDPAGCMVAVSMRGTIPQRAAMARALPLSAGAAFPDFFDQSSAGSMETAVKFMCAWIMGLCDHFGRPFSGNIESVSYSIAANYGGFSAVDFCLFFERAKSGQYRGEFQHVTAQGISWEFLQTWMESFAEEREAAIRSDVGIYGAKNQAGAIDGKVAGAIAAAQSLARAATTLSDSEKAALEKAADVFRAEWEKNVFENATVTQWYKHGPDGQLVLCEAGDASRIEAVTFAARQIVTGGAERILKREVFEFMSFGGAARMAEIMAEINERIDKSYGADADAVRPAEMRSIAGRLEKARASSLEAVLRFLSKKRLSEMGSEPGEDPLPVISETEVARYAVILQRKLESDYYLSYLPQCIADKYPALSKEGYVSQTALFSAIQAGFENPLLNILK